jgi:hypothetical protein
LKEDNDALNLALGSAESGELLRLASAKIEELQEKADAWDRYCELTEEIQEYVGCVRTPGDMLIAEQKRRKTIAELEEEIAGLNIYYEGIIRTGDEGYHELRIERDDLKLEIKRLMDIIERNNNEHERKVQTKKKS